MGTEFFDEVVEKYDSSDAVQNSSKVDGKYEMRGFERVHKIQSQIYRLRCIVLTGTAVSHLASEKLAPGKNFGVCTELDLSRTQVTKWSDLFNILSVFPSLKTLCLGHIKMDSLDQFLSESDKDHPFVLSSTISQLSVNYCSLSNQSANLLTAVFTNLQEIYIVGNSLKSFEPQGHSSSLRLIDIQSNPICDLRSLSNLSLLPELGTLNVSSCDLTEIKFDVPESDIFFTKLHTLYILDNPIAQWSSIDELNRLPSLKKLVVKGCPLAGARGVESREMIIAILEKLTELDKCEISAMERRSAEHLFLSRFSSDMPTEHIHTVRRLQERYGEQNGDSKSTSLLTQKIHSRMIRLEYKEKFIERELSLSLSIHRVVGLAARLLNFDPDDLRDVEIKRIVNGIKYPNERIGRTRDTLLRQMELADQDTIAFIS